MLQRPDRVVVALVCALSGGCGNSERAQVAAPMFVDATAASGITFVHDAAPTPERFLPEIIGPGVAMLDFDNDGDLDLYFVQGGGSLTERSSSPGNALWSNQWVETGRLGFIDVTAAAGVGDRAYGMGATAADLDNDGDTDLLVTNLGRDTLLRNNGDATFTDVTHEAGLDELAWSASATAADYDGDGLLDLFITHYTADPLAHHKACTNALDQREYCSPTAYPATADTLLRNLGQLRFADVSASAGVDTARGAGLGVLATDVNGDGALDFFVANDQTANFLWLNNGAGRFVESGLLSGSAYNGHGMAEASMGVTAADFDGDGDDDLFMTHLNAQSNTLYLNDGAGGFRDATDEYRLGSASLAFTGFGARWFDADNDGDLDLFAANGAVNGESGGVGDPAFPYAQRNQLFVLGADGRYNDVSLTAGAALAAVAVSRGAAFGDLDNDGDIDIVVANANTAPQLLENVGAAGRHWFGASVREASGKRTAIGARVGLVSGERVIWRRVARGGSYLSSNDPRVHFGLGERSAAVTVHVHWPDGSKERFRDLPIDAYAELRQGAGEEL